MINPVNLFWEYTEELYSTTIEQRTTEKNCKVIRDYLYSYVQKRVASQQKDMSENKKFDFLNHLLSNKEAFPSIDDVVDEIFDFFAAAAETTQAATQTILVYFIKNKSGLTKAREEFRLFYEEELAKDQSLSNASHLEIV